MTLTIKKYALDQRALLALPLAGLGAVVTLALSGCGGASTNGSPLAPTPESGPVVYGLNALGLNTGVAAGETSGAGYTDSTGALVGVLTGATAYTTDSGPGPLPAYTQSFAAGIPLGFAPDGSFYNSTAGTALPTTNAGSVVFRAYVSTGVHNNQPSDLVTTSVILTSSEAPALSQPLSFDKNFGSGQLGQTQYTTASFALPAALATTGLHNVQVSIADVAGFKSHTNFDFVEVAPTDSAILTPVTGAVVPAGQPAKTTATINSYTATITNPITGARTRAVLDDTNTIVLFAAPGSQTVTVTANVTLAHPDKTTQTVTQTGTETETLVAGSAFIGKGISVSGSTAAAALPAAHPRLKKK